MAANLKFVGISPTRIAIAFSNSTRRLNSPASSASVVASSVSARAIVQLVADAAFKAAARETHQFAPQLDLAAHCRDFGIERAQREIILRDVGLQVSKTLCMAASELCASARALSKLRRTRPHRSIS